MQRYFTNHFLVRCIRYHTLSLSDEPSDLPHTLRSEFVRAPRARNFEEYAYMLGILCGVWCKKFVKNLPV
jgi:hypothetical protein